MTSVLAAMNSSVSLVGRPRLYVAVGPDAEQLQIHLSSLGVHTAWDGPGQATRLAVLDHGREEVEAMLGQWEVAKG